MAIDPAVHSSQSLQFAYSVAPALSISFVIGAASSYPTGRETAVLFTLGQNHPNPHFGETTIPFTLAKAAEVKLGILDQAGRKVASVVRKGLTAGEHSISLNLTGLGLAAGSYVYQLQIRTRYGVYHQQKTMIAG